MGELESGYKWWLRYVIVPVVGGGGVIALIIALLARPTNSVFTIPPPTSFQSGEDESIEVNATAVDAKPLDELYVVDEHDNSFVKDVRVRKTSVFTIKWDARNSSSGQLHLLLLESNGQAVMDKKVGAMGTQKISSAWPIALKLLEEYGGKKRLIKALPVQVF